MNEIASSCAIYDCGRAPELGTTTCEHPHCQAAAGYLCRACSNLSGRASFDERDVHEPGGWSSGARLCHWHAVRWCAKHGRAAPVPAFPFVWVDNTGEIHEREIATVAELMLDLIGGANDLLRRDWDEAADLAGCHWLLVALLDLTSWPRDLGGLGAETLAPAMLDALIGEVAAQRRARSVHTSHAIQ